VYVTINCEVMKRYYFILLFYFFIYIYTTYSEWL